MGGLVMTQMTAQTAKVIKTGPRAALRMVATDTLPNSGSSAPVPYAQRRALDGIEVREEKLGAVTAQRVYNLRCNCGRSWFELDVPRLVQCPACAKMCIVTL
jgi:hypothetical protein